MRPVRGHIAGALLCGVIYAAASGFGLPFMIKKVLPVLFTEGERPDLTIVEFPEWMNFTAWTIPAAHVMTVAVLLLPSVFIIRGFSQFGKDYLLNYAGLRVLESLRLKVFERIQTLHLDFFRKISSGDLSSRMNNDTAQVRAALVDVLGDLLVQPLTLVASVGFVIFEASQTPGMGGVLLALLVVPLSVLPIRLIGKKLHKRAKQSLAQAGDMNSILIESLQAPREIRAYGLQQREIGRYREQTGKSLHLQMKQVKYLKLLSPVVEMIAACGITFAVYQAAQVHMSLSAVTALVTALYMSYDPVKKLGAVSTKLKQSKAALERLEEILHAPIEVADPASPKPMPEARGEITFDDVHFGYPDSNDKVFRDISLRIAPGEVVALVGPSGSGKSTFANLVPRFYDATSGRVLVDGVDVREVAQAELRSRVAIVSQEPILFNDTIAANLRLGKSDATDAELREATRKAGALAFIENFAEGFATRVGERGGLLSGGQRQRLAIARAFLKNAPILILDEATSALDAETEAQIQVALEELVKGKTVLIIAHRFSTIRFATRILVFDQAAHGVSADGPHATLLETSPLYRQLWDRQNLGEA
jgi:subfamily B ATP-binding cassette protein MsbA